MHDVDKQLLQANLGTHTRFWGVIDESTGSFVIKGTCRGCGEHGEFTTQQQADEFKRHHQGPNNRCPHMDEVVW